MTVLSDTARVHLRWALTDGVGPLTFARLLVQFGDAEKALGASAAQLESIKGVGREKSDRIARSRDSAEVDAEISAAEANGVRIICQVDAEFPAPLRRIPDTPIVLFVKGALRDTDAIAIAVVGSRRCTIYGSEQARRFGELLAQAGFTIVSGLARGIDAFAHHGAVDAGGRSIAVLGSGLHEVYPAENRTLAEKLLENGAWLSELPMKASVRAENFPSRNRIIAGLTLGTLVVEAASRSGALITARLANEYNREVFAVPGRVQDPMSRGTNELIRDGAAKLVMSLEDVLDGLGEVGQQMRTHAGAAAAAVQGELPLSAAGGSIETGDAGSATQPRSVDRSSAPRVAALSPVERRIYELIGYDPILQDAVLRAAELPPGEVLAAFTSLELRGLIKRLPGQLVVRRGTA
jgi:DNA processing protein